jgi:hypothetical protein
MKHQPDRSGPLNRRGARHALAAALLTVGLIGFAGAADSAAGSSSPGVSGARSTAALSTAWSPATIGNAQSPATIGSAQSPAPPDTAWSPVTLGTVRTPPTARAAHVLNVKDGGHLHEVRSSGAELLEEGPVSGTIPGKVKVSFDIGATITAKFTIYANGGGSLSGSGGGALHSTSVYSSFGGSLKVTGGSGRYAHAHGTGTLSGQIDRKTYALTVQADGKLYY